MTMRVKKAKPFYPNCLFLLVLFFAKEREKKRLLKLPRKAAQCMILPYCLFLLVLFFTKEKD